MGDGESGDVIVGGGGGDGLVGDRVKVVIGVGVVNGDGDCRVDVSVDDVVINAGDGHGLCGVPVSTREGERCVDGCFTGVTGGDGEDNI